MARSPRDTRGGRSSTTRSSAIPYSLLGRLHREDEVGARRVECPEEVMGGQYRAIVECMARRPFHLHPASAFDAFDAFTRVSDLLSWWCEGALVGLRPGGNWAIGFTNLRGRTEATVLGKIEEFERRPAARRARNVARAGRGRAAHGPFHGRHVRGYGRRLPRHRRAARAGRRSGVRALPRNSRSIGWEESLADLKRYLEGPRQRRVVVEAGLPEN